MIKKITKKESPKPKKKVEKIRVLRYIFHDLDQMCICKVVSVKPLNTKKDQEQKYDCVLLLGPEKVTDVVKSLHGNEPREGEQWSFHVDHLDDRRIPIGIKC